MIIYRQEYGLSPKLFNRLCYILSKLGNVSRSAILRGTAWKEWPRGISDGPLMDEAERLTVIVRKHPMMFSEIWTYPDRDFITMDEAAFGVLTPMLTRARELSAAEKVFRPEP